MFNMLDINNSALSAHRLFLDTISNNIANMNTTRGINGETYKRQTVIFEEGESFQNKLGVKATKIIDNRENRLVYNPEHPDANAEGYVEYPDINLSEEMANLIVAQRGYQMNLSTFNVIKDLYKQTIENFR